MERRSVGGATSQLASKRPGWRAPRSRAALSRPHPTSSSHGSGALECRIGSGRGAAGRASNSRWPGGGDGSAGGGGATSLAAVRRSMQPAKQLGSTLLGALAAQMRGAWDFCWQRWEAAPGCSGRRAAPCRGKGSAHEPCLKRPCHKAFRCCCPCRVHRCWSSSPGSSPCSARRATLSASGPSAAMRRSPATSPCAGRRRCSCWCVGLDVVTAGWLRFRGCVFCSAM